MRFILPFLLSIAAVNAQMLASWYGEENRGKRMANGQRFNPDALTCASWHYPLGSRLEVRTLSGSAVTVKVTDRGPHKRFNRRGIDLSLAAFKKLAGPEVGLVRVRIRKT